MSAFETTNWKGAINIPTNTSMTPEPADVLRLVETSLDDDKAEDVIVIDLAGKTELADYMVIASGTSQRQVGAMADHLHRRMKGLGVQGVAVEGLTQGDWVLIDGGDVIVHLFRPEVRTFYSLEKMWTDLPPPAAAEIASQEQTA